MTVNLDFGGITGAYNFEKTSSVVKQIFTNSIDQIQSIGDSTTALSTLDLQNFNNAMIQLKGMLAKQNIFSQGGSSTLDAAITAQMARGIGSLLQMLQAINPNVSLTPNFFTAANSGLDSLDQLYQWRNLYKMGFGSVVGAIDMGASTSTNTMLSFVELEYIHSGNTLLNDQMHALNEAMTATNDALSLLKTLQTIKNKASIMTNPTPNASQWNAGNPIIPGSGGFNVNLNSVIVNTDIARNLPGYYEQQVKSELGVRLRLTADATFAQQVTSQGPAIIAQINKVIAQLELITPVGGSAPTLLSEFRGILADIQAGQPGAVGQTLQQQFAWWLLDNHNSTAVTIPTIGTLSNFNPSNGGDYQRNLTSTIATAEALNSAQNNQLKQVLFIFQEFYKSSSKMLKDLERLAKQMGKAESA